MKSSPFLPCALALSLATPASPLTAAEELRPNVILILADDLGWKDAAFRGSRYYETPNLDRLAAQSVEFPRAYACPSCVPSRAALLSGQYSPRTGVFMVGRSDRGNRAAQKLVPVPNREDLTPEVVTIAEALRQAGYTTGIIGKWHLGDGDSSPEAKGFTHNVAAYNEGTPPTYFSPYRMPKIQDGPPGEYLTDRLTDEAVAFVEANKDRPFFLYLPHYAVHVPIEARKELEKYFQGKAPDGEQKNAAYAAMIKSLDEGVGRLLDAVDRLGLAGRTHIVFTSDNGGQMGITAQPPLRQGKGWLFEGGIRVPFLIRSPGTEAAGTLNETPVHLVDLYPTILEWAGVAPLDHHALDGVSLSALATGKKTTLSAPRDLYWHFPGYQPLGDGFRITPSSVILSWPWKLTEKFEDGSTELYNLEIDPEETHNLAATETERAAELGKRLQDWRKSLAAPVPTEPNKSDKP